MGTPAMNLPAHSELFAIHDGVYESVAEVRAALGVFLDSCTVLPDSNGDEDGEEEEEEKPTGFIFIRRHERHSHNLLHPRGGFFYRSGAQDKMYACDEVVGRYTGNGSEEDVPPPEDEGDE